MISDCLHYILSFGLEAQQRPHLFQASIPVRITKKNTTINTSLVRKLNFWLFWLFFPLKLSLVQVLAHILNRYIEHNVYSNDKSKRLKLQEHQAFDTVLKTFEIRNFPTNLMRVETFRHTLRPYTPIDISTRKDK